MSSNMLLVKSSEPVPEGSGKLGTWEPPCQRPPGSSRDVQMIFRFPAADWWSTLPAFFFSVHHLDSKWVDGRKVDKRSASYKLNVKDHRGWFPLPKFIILISIHFTEHCAVEIKTLQNTRIFCSVFGPGKWIPSKQVFFNRSFTRQFIPIDFVCLEEIILHLQPLSVPSASSFMNAFEAASPLTWSDSDVIVSKRRPMGAASSHTVHFMVLLEQAGQCCPRSAIYSG